LNLEPSNKELETKLNQGACKNCGSLNHNFKLCLEKPHEKGVKEKKLEVSSKKKERPTDYEGKRDRWHNYDPNTFKTVVQHYQKTQELRQSKKRKELEEELTKRSKKKIT